MPVAGRWRWLLLPACAFILGTCSPPRTPNDGVWVSEEVFVDGVRTIRTLSGSVWKEPAYLVEEVSIGRDEEGPYLLGDIRTLGATDDRIYLFDSSYFKVRVYDWEGRHLFDFGERGAGPGEFLRPEGLGVSQDQGWVVVRDPESSRMNIYSLDGELLDTWPLRSNFFSPWSPTIITHDGAVFVPVVSTQLPSRSGVGRTGPRGTALDTLWVPRFSDGERYMWRAGRASGLVPFAPRGVWTFGADGVLIHGFSNRYRITLTNREGETWAIERVVDPIPVEREEKTWHSEALRARLRTLDPGITWTGTSIPDAKPFFSSFFADQSGRVWVTREGHGIPRDVEGQTAPVRWTAERLVEVFEITGAYLGLLELPEGIFLGSSSAWIRDDVLIIYSSSVGGIPMVKRYRIVIP